MKDFNFFAPYQGKQKQAKDKKIYIYTLGLVLIVVIFGTLIWNSVSIFLLNRDIKKYNSSINAADVQQKYKEAEDINNKSSILNKYNASIDIINATISKKDRISSETIHSINSTLPKEVSFASITIDENAIDLQGSAKNRQAIGEFQHNMKELDIVSDAQIINISDVDNGNYKFELKCTLKDVDK
ncbi:PilN domain-containing protein [Clostridium sp. 'White wine YQ']|uniref:PilN domain-containing protein n=1 Tax=Clostridium sp. 'White wine YQ' TaxID=3027474 RepID=UPI002366E254|nr:PilN domain-containing protein [Clostridium sp. 'White wine YQ']MDD7795765.1 PilN domain-containing protein [Clostridium sp. 'White wine YQ']